MVNIVCVKVGTKYKANDVNRLYRMVDLNMSIPYNFYCFTDDEEGLLLPIKKKRVYDLPLHSYWWKMTIFDKAMWDNNEPTLYLDLDVIIQNDITYLFEKVNRELIRIGYIGTDVIIREMEQKHSRLKYYADVNYDMTHFIYWDDWYSAYKAYPSGKKTKESFWQPMETSEGKVSLMVYPDSAICITNAYEGVTANQEQEVMDKLFSFYYG